MGIEKLREDQKRWNVMFGGLGGGKPPAIRSSVAAKPKGVAECVYRGAEVRRELCETCKGRVQVKVFTCAKHGECTIANSFPHVHVCDGNPVEQFTLNGTRHFLYHIAAMKHTETWRRNVEQVLRRLWLFNGKRVVAIADGPEMVPPDEVVAAFRGEVDTFVVPNIPAIGEVATFQRLLTKVQPYDSDVTFYAHAKGVSRPVNAGVTVHRWADILYEVNLDYFQDVFDLLCRFPIVGAFKKIGRSFRSSQSTWHYSGTFYWFQNRDVFARAWQNIDLMWGGTEAWPGTIFRPEEAGSIFHAGRLPTLNLYSMPYLINTVIPAFEQWKKDHERQRLTWEPQP